MPVDPQRHAPRPGARSNRSSPSAADARCHAARSLFHRAKAACKSGTDSLPPKTDPRQRAIKRLPRFSTCICPPMPVLRILQMRNTQARTTPAHTHHPAPRPLETWSRARSRSSRLPVRDMNDDSSARACRYSSEASLAASVSRSRRLRRSASAPARAALRTPRRILRLYRDQVEATPR